MTDTAGRSRKQTTDALGRLSSVVEAPGSSAYLTTYSYDALDNLTGVVQAANGTTLALSRTFSYDSLRRLLDATNPESGRINWDYDGNGNVVATTLARAISVNNTSKVVVSHTYDDLNRLTGKTYNDGATPPVVNCYDGMTYAAGICSGSVSQNSYGQMTGNGSNYGSNALYYSNYTHDDEGRVASSTQRVEAAERRFGYSYYADDQLATMTLPGSKSRVTCYDAYGRPVWVSGQLTKTDCGTAAPTTANAYGWVPSYAAHGAIEQLKFGLTGDMGEQWCYNSRLQVTRMRLGAGVASNCVYQGGDQLGLRLEYTSTRQAQNNGNVMQQYIQARKSSTDATETRLRQDYGYDALNRLNYTLEAVEAGTGLGWQRDWSYDSRGNLAVTGAVLVTGTPTVLEQYEQATNRLQYFRGNLAIADRMNYDDSGNLTDRPADLGSVRTTYEWDAENRRRKVNGGGTQESFYDGMGRRVKKVGGGSTSLYFYDAAGQLVLEEGSPVSTPELQFLTQDHLGSVRLALRASDGRVISRMDYEPFGSEIVTTSRVADGYSGDASLRQRFTGKERDAETGMDYFGARYMSSAQGRFTSPDEPLIDQYQSDPQSWNLYSYVRNNPLRNVDPTGRTCVPDGNGGYKDIDGPGGTCADALKGDIAEGKNPSVKVTAQAPPSLGLLALALGTRRAEPVVNAVGVGTGIIMAGAGAGVAYGAYTGGTGLIALGVAGGPAIFQAGQIIDKVYQTSGGPVRFVAEVAVEGSQLVLKDILVYPVETGRRIAIGVKEVLQAARPLLEQAKQDGYTSVRFIADRSLAAGSANPGRPVDFVKTLR